MYMYQKEPSLHLQNLKELNLLNRYEDKRITNQNLPPFWNKVYSLHR